MRSLSLESISKQPSHFFNDLTEQISTIRNTHQYDISENLKGKYESIYKTELVTTLSDIISKYTNLNVTIKYDNTTFAAIYWPTINKNNILMGQSKQYLEHMTEDDALTMSKSLKTKVIKNSIDLVNNKVHGGFTTIVKDLILGTGILLDTKFKPSECAAIILHEVGHMFTFLEFSDRLITTNAVLSLTMNALDNKYAKESRDIIIANVANKAKLTPLEITELNKSTNKEASTVIVLNALLDVDRDELGKNNRYQYTSSEQLADQYAIMCGAGKDLSLALDKLDIKSYAYNSNLSVFILSSTLPLLIIASPFISGVFLFVLISILTGETGIQTYDDIYHRHNRIQLSIIQELKNTSISKEERENLLMQLEEINTVLKNLTKDGFTITTTISKWVRPGFRKVKDFEDLQKDLESLSNNNLFKQSAILSTLESKTQ